MKHANSMGPLKVTRSHINLMVLMLTGVTVMAGLLGWVAELIMPRRAARNDERRLDASQLMPLQISIGSTVEYQDWFDGKSQRWYGHGIGYAEDTSTYGDGVWSIPDSPMWAPNQPVFESRAVHEEWIIGSVGSDAPVTLAGRMGDSRGISCPIALSSAISRGGLDSTSFQEENNGTGIYNSPSNPEHPPFKIDAELESEGQMEATEQLEVVANYLLQTAEAMHSRGGNFEAALSGAQIFGAFLHSMRTSAGLDRGEASHHAQLNKQLWIAMEQGFVPLADVEKYLPRLAQGLGVTHADLCRVFDEALGLSET